MKWTVLIIDDEPLARKLISNLLKNVSEFEIVGLYGTGREAINAIDALKPDILFLDIQLKDITGFNVLEEIKTKPSLIIFVTAFDTYAIEAFNIFAFDYLLKPFTEERFYESIKRALETLRAKKGVEIEKTVANLLEHIKIDTNIADSSKKRIPVPYRNKTIFIDVNCINYILASNYYIEIYTSKSKYVLRNSMRNIIAEFDANRFVRIHRSSIVNLSAISELNTSQYGEMELIMNDLKRLRVSKGYRKEFLLKMGIRK